MADLTTAVGELLKKKNTEENLHIYVEGLSSLYKRMAELRLAMNYYTFAEIYSDFDFAKMPDEDAEEAREGLVEEKGFFILPSRFSSPCTHRPIHRISNTAPAPESSAQ